jgi:hypothetical protein
VPEFAPIGENHLLRSTSIVNKVAYRKGSIEYQTFDKVGTEVLRVNFRPVCVMAGDSRLSEHDDLKDDGYSLRELPGGDYEVQLRHVQSNELSVSKN